MTQKQFDICVKNKIPIYKIWIKEKFHKEKVTYEYAEKGIDWINEKVVYDIETHCYCMFTSEDMLYKSIDKLFKCLEDIEKERIKIAKTILNHYERIKNNMGISSNVDDDFIDELINC